MANVFLNETVYANTMLLMLKNELKYGRLVDGQYKNMVTDKNGLSINVKRPPRFLVKDGATLQAQDIVTGSVNVAVTQYKNVHLSIGDLEAVKSFNDLMSNSSMKSAASAIASYVDSYLAGFTLRFNSWVAGASTGGVNASDPTVGIKSPVQAMAAHTRLMAQGVPNGSDLCAVVGFPDAELIRGSLTGGFIQPTNKNALARVKIPIISEIDWYATQQLPTFTTGTRLQGDGSSSGCQIAGASQNVNYRDVKDVLTQTLSIDGGGSGATYAAGDVFTIQNVYAYDPRANGGAGQTLDYLQQFTVTAAAAQVGTAAVALTISPPIIVKGTSDGTSTDANTVFATVDSAPANDAYVKFAGAPSTILRVRSAWHKQAIALVSAKLETPMTGVASFAQDPETGISIRYWRGSDFATGTHGHRFDLIFGAAIMDPALGTRICGST